MKLSIIIPNYNGYRYLKSCLSSLALQTFTDYEIIFVDNGSTDNSLSYIQQHFPAVRTFALSCNHGFSYATNKGLSASHGEYIMLLNNDTILDRDCLKYLVCSMDANPQAFSVGARILSQTSPTLIDTLGDYYSIMGYAFCGAQGLPPSDYPLHSHCTPVFTNCACAAVYRKEMLAQTGLFDPHFFAYLEDVDLGFRARRLGFTNIHCPSAMVRHAGSGTTGSKYTAFKVFHSARNNMLLRRKNLTIFQRILHLPFFLCGFLLKLCFFQKKGLHSAYMKGCVSGLRSFRHPTSSSASAVSGIRAFLRTEPWILYGTLLYTNQFLKRHIKHQHSSDNTSTT